MNLWSAKSLQTGVRDADQDPFNEKMVSLNDNPPSLNLQVGVGSRYGATIVNEVVRHRQDQATKNSPRRCVLRPAQDVTSLPNHGGCGELGDRTSHHEVHEGHEEMIS
jgi:hypothetical protein